MNYIIEICIAIDIAILGISYPILVDKISNIGTKYNSEYLPNIFDSEFPQSKILKNTSFFQLVLILTVCSFIFKIISFEPYDYFDEIFLIENSADILILLLTTVLTFSFICWLNKIMLYQGKASELLKYLINKYKNQKEDNQFKTYLLKTINEFTIYAIEKQDIHLQASLVDFYSSLFLEYRENFNEEDGAVYPNDLYNITNEIITSSINNKNQKLKMLENQASSGSWLTGGSFTHNKISKLTYNWLWRNIVSSSNHKKLISNYWSSASQYYDYSLSRIAPEYDGLIITNQEKIDNINKERNRFKELNFALGGLLYYQNNFNTLKYILTFSQSQPPSYPLLPQTMDEIFYWFDQFSSDFKNFDDPIEYKYFFPEIDNLGVSRSVNHNICLYISLLFVRQFTQHTIYIYQNFKIFHNLTNNLQDLYSYNNKLTHFKYCIEQVLSNEDLLKTLNYNVNNDEIFETFGNLEADIKERIDLTKLNASLSVDKINSFNNKAEVLISKALDEYKSIENTKDFDNIDDNIVLSISGELVITSKSSFTDNDIPHMNFDTVYSENIVNSKIKYFLPNSFLVSKTERYLIEQKQLLEGLQKIIKNSENKLIVAIRPSYESERLLMESDFKEMLIVIPSSNHRIVDTFFILDKKDLPKFESKDLSKEEKEKFKLDSPLNDNYKLYSNVIDINLQENQSLKEEYITNEDDELKVLIIIAFIFLIKWRKDRKIIMLSLTSPYREQGILNDIEELKPI